MAVMRTDKQANGQKGRLLLLFMLKNVILIYYNNNKYNIIIIIILLLFKDDSLYLTPWTTCLNAQQKQVI